MYLYIHVSNTYIYNLGTMYMSVLIYELDTSQMDESV